MRKLILSFRINQLRAKRDRLFGEYLETYRHRGKDWETEDASRKWREVEQEIKRLEEQME